MAVYVAVCEIFIVKEWRDLENMVIGSFKSLKWHHLIDSTSSYKIFVVTVALSCMVCEI